MADSTPESAPLPEEPQDQPVPAVSEVSEVKPASAPVGLTEDKLAEILEARFKVQTENLERQFQSIKDRRIGKIESRLDDLVALREQAEKRGWDTVIADAEQAEVLEARVSKILDARLPSAPVARSPEDDWRAEWAGESKKTLDAAEKLGVRLTTEEYNAALFGKKFNTKADAYAALNAAIIAKAKGEGTPVAAVTVDGGLTAKPPEAKPPTTWKQDYDRALAANDRKKARELLDKRWEDVERQQKLEAARVAAREAGVSIAET